MEQPVNNRLGIYGIPGTFPTGKVLDQVKKSDPHGLAASQWTREKINDAWYWYKEAILKGADPWTQTNRQAAAYISENTNISLSDANQFGFSLYTLSKNGEIANEFYTGKVSSAEPQLSNILPTESLLKVNSTIKWVAAAGVIAFGLYFTWPLLIKARSSLKKRLANG